MAFSLASPSPPTSFVRVRPHRHCRITKMSKPQNSRDPKGWSRDLPHPPRLPRAMPTHSKAESSHSQVRGHLCCQCHLGAFSPACVSEVSTSPGLPRPHASCEEARPHPPLGKRPLNETGPGSQLGGGQMSLPVFSRQLARHSRGGHTADHMEGAYCLHIPLTLPLNFRGPGYGGASSQPSSGHWELGPAVLGAAGLLRAGQCRGQEALRAAAGPVGSAETCKPMAEVAGGAHLSGTQGLGEVHVLPLQLAGRPARAGGAAGGDHGLLPAGRGPALLTWERLAPLRGSWARVGRKPCLRVSPPWDGVVSDPGSPALRGSLTDAPQGVGALFLGRLDGTHLLCLL